VINVNKSEAEHLFGHWIEHNKGHAKSFRDRAEEIKEISSGSAIRLREAAELMDRCTEKLVDAKEKL